MYDPAGNLLAGGRRPTSNTYDALNRVIEKRTYGSNIARFTYDAMGHLLTANDPAARIRRTYNPDGTLATDTLRIATRLLADSNFAAHVYGIRYAYDLDKRRTTIHHPALGPVANGTTQYAYDAQAGLLTSVTDVFGNVFTFGYDGDRRITRTTRLTQRADSVVETLAYDSVSRLVRRHIQGGTTVIHDDSLVYDSRGYLAGNTRTGDVIGYDGLGRMISVHYNGKQEQYAYDPRGNQTVVTTYGAGYSQSHYTYAPHSDRLAQAVHPMSPVWDTTYYIIDRDGAVGEEIIRHYFTLSGGCDLCSGTYVEQRDVVNTYDLARRLIGNRFRLDTLNYDAPKYQPYSRNETYRYDALDRRVWQQMVRDTNCVTHDANSGCRNTVIRTIWDGDQLLYETREAPDTTKRLEPEPSNSTYYGVVGYTHAMGIDAPIDLFKGNSVVVPYTDWRGKYDKGTCPAALCDPLAILFPGADMSTYGDAAPTGCVCRTTTAGTVCEPPSWFGSIIMEMQDGSGYQYRRNRMYDPATGRFTQEDPIGVAGGLNVYGFANGDPVNYADPFGLCPVCVVVYVGVELAEVAEEAYTIYQGARIAGALLKEADEGNPADARTEPTLPDKEIASEGGVTIEHNYRSGDHGPAHLHVTGGGRETKIGQNGKPLKGEPELTPQQQRAVNNNKAAIRRAVGKIGRWLDYQEKKGEW